MVSIAKPNTKAFVLNPDKVDKFMQNCGSSQRIMERFYAHKPKDGVATPLKGKIV